MTMKQINDLLNKIPFIPITLLYCLYLGYGYYDFMRADDSELGLKKAQVNTAKNQLIGAKKRLESSQDFLKNMDSIRERIKSLSQQLESTKTTLSGEVDLASFIRVLSLEAKKIGLTIQSIKPSNEIKKDYYVEVPFDISLKGAYVQMLVFFDRVVRLQQLVRVSSFDLKPAGNLAAKFVELDGKGTLTTFKYLDSNADTLSQSDLMKDNDSALKKLKEQHLNRPGGNK